MLESENARIQNANFWQSPESAVEELNLLKKV